MSKKLFYHILIKHKATCHFILIQPFLKLIFPIILLIFYLKIQFKNFSFHNFPFPFTENKTVNTRNDLIWQFQYLVRMLMK